MRDLAALQVRSPVPYEACERRPGRVSSLSLVRYERNDYSVPTAYGHRAVLVRGYVDEVVIVCGAEIIARHKRCYAREDFVLDPLHYLALLEQKTGALDQAAALQGWDLPEAFATLRRLLEARMGKVVALIAPAIIALLSDGLPRSRHEILEALAPQHAKDEVKRTIMRLSVTGRLVEAKHKYSLTPAP